MFKSMFVRANLIILAGFILALPACSQQAKPVQNTPAVEQPKKKVKKEVAVIETDFGNIILNFYENDAPKHVANFKKLAKEGFYNGTTFHRVMPNFMIQGGDPNSKDQIPGNDGMGGPGYTIPAEIKRWHKRGALAAARQSDQVNPKKESSGSQFYIVQNGPIPFQAMKQMEAQMQQGKPGFYFTEKQMEIYTTIGGTPFLDGEYTVYGEVVAGMDVVDQIALVERDRRDRPIQNVLIKNIKFETMEIEE